MPCQIYLRTITIGMYNMAHWKDDSWLFPSLLKKIKAPSSHTNGFYWDRGPSIQPTASMSPSCSLTTATGSNQASLKPTSHKKSKFIFVLHYHNSGASCVLEHFKITLPYITKVYLAVVIHSLLRSFGLKFRFFRIARSIVQQKG